MRVEPAAAAADSPDANIAASSFAGIWVDVDVDVDVDATRCCGRIRMLLVLLLLCRRYAASRKRWRPCESIMVLMMCYGAGGQIRQDTLPITPYALFGFLFYVVVVVVVIVGRCLQDEAE
jgi:hypothetical protein